jgi:S-adenosyl-L-methionine hydrolase (adenosine-forming)
MRWLLNKIIKSFLKASFMSIISLLSDFGIKDSYVAQMKAIILSINPKARIIDITHEIEKFNIRNGAFVLASAVTSFPPKTIHVAVVDPGVGTKRRPIIIKTKKSLYVGPDNGLLILAASQENIVKIYSIENSKYISSNISKTFHGRDIFAPAAAYLSTGISSSLFGKEIHDHQIPEFTKKKVENGQIIGEILYIDDFGNVISNISKEDLRQARLLNKNSLNITVGSNVINLDFSSAYGNVPIGDPLTLIGSSSFLECSVNRGSFSRLFNAEVGEIFIVSV